MTDTAVKLDAGSGTATIEISGIKTVEPRFRLRDPATEKYLTRRGWTKTPSFLPIDAALTDNGATLTLDAELTRKVIGGATLSLEQPSANLFVSLVWPKSEALAEEEQSEEPSSADQADDLPEPVTGPIDLLAGIETLEPSVRDETIIDAPPPKNGSDIDEPFEDEEPPRPWSLIAGVAAVALLVGLLIGFLWQGSSYDTDIKTAMKAVEAQRDQERENFKTQLAAAKAEATNSANINAAEDQSAALGAEVERLKAALLAAEGKASSQANKAGELESQLATIKQASTASADKAAAETKLMTDRIAELDTSLAQAKQELQARDQSLTAVQEQLTRTKNQVDALEQAAARRDEADANAADGRLAEANKALDELRKQLAARDQAMRDIEAKLSVANVQIEALKEAAANAAKSELESKANGGKLADLEKQLSQAKAEIANKQKELDQARTSLDTANALLAANPSAAPASAESTNAEQVENRSDLQRERDLYKQELETLTKSFAALQQEKQTLIEKLKGLEDADTSGPAAIPAQTASTSRAIWGATAIDANGAVYSLQNQIGEQSANDNVLALCRGKSNGRCQPLRSYSNSCFSLARIEGEDPRNDNFGFATNRDWRRAEAEAKRQCEELGESCTIRFTACSPDAISKPVAKSE